MDRKQFSLNAISYCIKMRYLIEPRESRYVKGYGFLSFARNLGTYATKVAEKLNNNYGQKLAYSAKKSATDALKIAGKSANQKTAEASGDLVDNFIADKTTSIKKKQQVNHTQMQLALKHEKKDIYLHKKDKKILMN